VSALEQEAQLVTGIAVSLSATPSSVAATFGVPGVGADTSLSAIFQKVCPFKVVRVRGLAYVTATASLLAVGLFRGAGTGGSQVNVTLTLQGSGITAAVGQPIPFEFFDSAPTGIEYTLGLGGSAACTAAMVYSVTGYNG
jgi:hypothetical protein